jgi:hypothetical protein
MNGENGKKGQCQPFARSGSSVYSAECHVFEIAQFLALDPPHRNPEGIGAPFGAIERPLAK